MLCFNHSEKVSVGSCKNCFKGICVDCSLLVDDIYLSCSLVCKDRVKVIEDYLDNVIVKKNMSAMGFYSNLLFVGLFIVLGGVFFFYLDLKIIGYIYVVFALLSFVHFNFFNNKMFGPKKN